MHYSGMPQTPPPRASARAMARALASVAQLAPLAPCAALARALLLPDARCRLCALPSRAPLCAACQCAYSAAAVRRCARCAIALPVHAACCAACACRPPAFVRAVAWADYAPPLDRLALGIKFGGDAALAAWLGTLLALRVRETAPATPALVLPVPLAASRLRQRGYNQAWELARGVARSLGWPSDCGLLSRPREGQAQSTLPLSRRAANVRSAFHARALPRGTRVLLVDDVMTSGSTAEHAARALLRAGAAEVALAVLLRTPAPGPRAEMS